MRVSVSSLRFTESCSQVRIHNFGCCDVVLAVPFLSSGPCVLVPRGPDVMRGPQLYWRRTAQWRKSNIPFLPPSFLIGHKYFWDVINNSLVTPLNRIYRENADKDVVGFFMATQPMVLVRNPALIKQIFVKNLEKDFGALPDDGVAKHMPALTADLEQWKSNRKTLMPMYSTARVGGERFTKIRDQIHNMWTHIEETRRQGKSIALDQISLNFLFDGISKSFFGLDANSYKKKGELLRLLQTSARPSLMEMLKSFITLNLRGMKALKNQTEFPQERVESMKNMIQEQMAERERTKNNENDFIDLLLKLKREKSHKMSSSEMAVTNQIVGFGLSILFGNNGPSCCSNLKTITLNAMGLFSSENELLPSTVIHLLSLYPEHQERIRQEVEGAMKKHNTTEFTCEVVKDLHFLNQCLHETARLFPTGPALTRILTEDLELPGTEYTFKKGERVIVDPYSVHRDPKYFKNPDEFNPDRFSPENKGKISPETFLSFGSGPRKCPGKNMALLMMSTMIGSIVYKYEVKPCSHVKQMEMCDFHPRSYGIRPKDELLVDVVPRDVTVC